MRTARTDCDELNADGFRVVAVAYKEMPSAQMSRPIRQGRRVRPDAARLHRLSRPAEGDRRAAIDALQADGVAVKILTGDNEIVTAQDLPAKSACRRSIVLLGTPDRGDEPTTELAEAAGDDNVFASCRRRRRQRIIQALQRKGHVVGFLGDGINDAPALQGRRRRHLRRQRRRHRQGIGRHHPAGEEPAGARGGRASRGARCSATSSSTSRWARARTSATCSAWSAPARSCRSCRWLPIQVLINNLLYDFSQTADPDRQRRRRTGSARPRQWDIGNIRQFMLFIGPISSIFDYVDVLP